ncbi:vWA domain-containing protein [Thiohalophilus thiocyanatoxydans]|uniref:Ca-activated chloride channel family protein n=1 Tax=Thiohalophilus thiocyanatoxydans TaxID=381308 RepID=A0A4R8IY19_9GAMM|nr:VWA domain-containing protein [Thiohalophilus thiocyanatoxydans]TDY02817.1 Ca-activated chloride channel family protein [Thiohalophilus thiocyanatoxydans]
MMGGLADLVWREPAWFAVALVPWLWLLGRYLWSATDSRAYADPALLPWARVEQHRLQRWRRHWRELLSVLAWLLLAAALAGPRLPHSLHSEETDRLPELMVVLDVSHSMSADDIYPTRLERARLELQDLLERLEGWRIGMVVYAAQPHLLVPPTHDKALLRHYLPIPRTGLLPVEGSDPASALQFAAGTGVTNDVPRHLLLISDGAMVRPDSESEQALQETVTALQQNGHRLYILGVGSESGTNLTDPDGGWLEQDGQSVLSRLQRARLEALAERGGGRYATARDDDRDWQQLYDNGLAGTLSDSLSEQSDGLVIWRELFAWCLLPGLALLLLAHLRLPRQRPTAGSLSLLLGFVLVANLFGVPNNSYAAQSDALQQAWQAFEQEDYAKAQKAYRRVAGYRGRMGEGSSAYLREEFRTALQQFTRAVAMAQNATQRADALFNLGNSYARLERYTQAATIYADVLRYQTSHTRAEQNRTLAEKLAREQVARERRDERGRQGRGTRTRELEEDEQLTRGNLTLSDQSESEGIALGDAHSDEAARRESGGATLSDETIMERTDPQWDYAVNAMSQLASRASGMDSEPARFWQRLFESEAGYPAPLEQPENKAGVRPW